MASSPGDLGGSDEVRHVAGWPGVQELTEISAPMYFLSNTDTGSLINRYVFCIGFYPGSLDVYSFGSFSQDMRLVDITLPVALAVFLFGESLREWDREGV
jgi:hypothetical protein